MIKLECQFCGRDFEAQKRTALYCSNNCRVKSYNQKRKEKGLKTARSIKSYRFIRDVNYEKVIKIKMDYNNSFSKNVILGRGGYSKRVYLKKQARLLRDEMYWLINIELKKNKIEFVEDKIWLDIFVQRPDAGGIDAINVLDLIADGVQDAIKVDDKWFSVKCIDWEIKKENPKIFIEIGQAGDNIPKKICSYCGRILPKGNFNKNKSSIDGYNRICQDCIKIK